MRIYIQRLDLLTLKNGFGETVLLNVACFITRFIFFAPFLRNLFCPSLILLYSKSVLHKIRFIYVNFVLSRFFLFLTGKQTAL